MNLVRIIFLSVIFLFFNLQPALAQGKLDEVKKEAEKTEAPKSEESRSNSDNHHESHSQSSLASDFDFFRALVIPLTITYYVVVGHYQTEEHLHNAVTAYPYYYPNSGNYVPLSVFDSSYSVARLDLMENFLFSDDLYANHLRARLRPNHIIYFQIDYIELLEPRTFESGFDNLALFNFNLCYDRVRLNDFNLGWMAGVNLIGSGVGRAGFTYGVSLEYFTPWKVSLYSSMRGSKINKRPLDQFEVYGRYSVDRFAISVGYEFIRLMSLEQGFFGVGFNFYL